MDSNSRIKGLIRFIFSYIIEKEDNLEGEEIIEELLYEGYSQEEIEYALLWVSMLFERSLYLERDEVVSDLDSIDKAFTRPFNSEERNKLTPQAQGLIYWLTWTGQLSPKEREDILDIISYVEEESVTKEMVFTLLDTLYISDNKRQGDDLLRKYYYN